MDNNQEEALNTYSIPLNYKQAGTWKNLRIPNLIEGVILAVIADSFIIKMPFTFQFKILVLIILSGGILIFAIHGINGERISLFLLVTLKYLLKRLSRKTKYHIRKVGIYLSLIHISEPTRLRRISYAVFCLKKKKKTKKNNTSTL